MGLELASASSLQTELFFLPQEWGCVDKSVSCLDVGFAGHCLVGEACSRFPRFAQVTGG